MPSLCSLPYHCSTPQRPTLHASGLTILKPLGLHRSKRKAPNKTEQEAAQLCSIAPLWHSEPYHLDIP